MPALSEYSNVYNTALLILQRKGFRFWYDSEAELFCAERDGWDFMAPSPVGLLGLIAIYEFKQPDSYREYWWREEGGDLYRDCPTERPEYKPIWSKQKSG
jgi:hypothetical protein